MPGSGRPATLPGAARFCKIEQSSMRRGGRRGQSRTRASSLRRGLVPSGQRRQSGRVRAYQRAALRLLRMSEDASAYLDEQGELDLPGLGQRLRRKVGELVRTGRMSFQDELIAAEPRPIRTLMTVPGIGPKTADRLVDELKIRGLKSLARAARRGRLHQLRGIGPGPGRAGPGARRPAAADPAQADEAVGRTGGGVTTRPLRWLRRGLHSPDAAVAARDRQSGAAGRQGGRSGRPDGGPARQPGRQRKRPDARG